MEIQIPESGNPSTDSAQVDDYENWYTMTG